MDGDNDKHLIASHYSFQVPITQTYWSSHTWTGVDDFTVNHYDFSSSSQHDLRYQLHGKRKPSMEDSTFYPKSKQLITESRIASSMERLSINQELRSNTNRTSDEGFFDENECEFNEFENEEELDISEGSNRHNSLPRYVLVSDVKDKLQASHCQILPKKVFETINQSCMALVPYIPSPIHFSTKTNNDESEDEFWNTNSHVTQQRSSTDASHSRMDFTEMDSN